MPNLQVIQELNGAALVTNIYAYLQDVTGKSLFTFLYNPEAKRFSRQSNYNAGVTALTSTPSQQYQHTTGLTLQLSDLIMISHSEGKTCKQLLQNLQNLMVADPAEGKFSPTPVYFTWGTDKFGPAVITSLDWTETAWLDGQVAEARVNFSLLEIPSSVAPLDPSQAKLEKAALKKQTLTNRQKNDALIRAETWITNNIKKINPTILERLRARKFELTVSNGGTVNLIVGKNVWIVGQYVNGKLDTSSNNLAFRGQQK